MYHFNGYNISVSIEDKPIKIRNSNQLKREKNIQKILIFLFYLDM